MADLVLITATSWGHPGAVDAIRSWQRQAPLRHPLIVVENSTRERPAEAAVVKVDAAGFGSLVSPVYLGPVAAFAKGMAMALALYPEATAFCCFHDDLWIEQPGWDAQVLRRFAALPTCGLIGFCGATQLGTEDLRRVKRHEIPFAPMMLARGDVWSNMRHAEAHGQRTTTARQVACLDGFALILRREFARGGHRFNDGEVVPGPAPWAELQQAGIVHHFYDGAMGLLAKKQNWQVWLEPIACHHAGGQTAVGDQMYHRWAKTQRPDGDQDFWTEAHEIGWQRWGQWLPVRVD